MSVFMNRLTVTIKPKGGANKEDICRTYSDLLKLFIVCIMM